MTGTPTRRGDEGFTLIELLIVIIILAILAAIVVFAVGSAPTNARIAACNSDAKSVETAVESYKAQNPNDTYPPSLPDLTTTTRFANGVTGGPWLRQVPTANTSANGYAISYSTGVVYVETSGGAFVNYDTNANACG